MERRGAHGVETIAPPQEVKRASSKACRAKNLQVSAIGRDAPIADSTVREGLGPANFGQPDLVTPWRKAAIQALGLAFLGRQTAT